MDIVAVDFGSHTIKVMEFSTHGGHLILHDYQRWQTPKESEPQKALFAAYNLLKSHLGSTGPAKRVIFQLPPRMYTVRMQDFPKVSRKKINLMLPFQLEESLPFALTDVHYAFVLVETANQTKALTNVVTLEDFRPLYEYWQTQEILPQILTTEVFVWQNIIQNDLANRSDAYPVAYGILDLGHQFTKAYFFHQQVLVAYHEEAIAGAAIDEILTTTYGKSPAEISAYKEKNGYLLNEEQISSLDQDQANFVRLLNNAIHPLLQNLRAWLLSYRAKYDGEIATLYLVGGTSKLHNMANYLEQYLGIEVKPFDVYGEELPDNLAAEDRVDFSLAFALGRCAASSIPPGNLLTKNFSPDLQSEVALPSAVFVALRVFLVFIVLMAALAVDRVFLNKTDKHLRAQVTKQLERSEFGINKKERQKLLKHVKNLVPTLRKKNQSVAKAVKTLQTRSTENPLKPFLNLVGLSELRQAQVENFSRQGTVVEGDISAATPEILQKIQGQMEAQKWRKFSAEIDPDALRLHFQFEFEGER